MKIVTLDENRTYTEAEIDTILIRLTEATEDRNYTATELLNPKGDTN